MIAENRSVNCATPGLGGSAARIGSWLVLILGLLVSLWSWHLSETAELERIGRRFDAQVTRPTTAIQNRMSRYERALRAGAGLLGASDRVSRNEWRIFASALRLGEEYPGIQGIFWSVFVGKNDLSAHESAIRDQGLPDYRVHPTGEREIYSAIVYLEPLDLRNRQVLGYDMFAEPIRRRVMEVARDSGQPRLSGKVTLIQETDTEDERRAAIVGFVHSPFRMRDPLEGIVGDSPPLSAIRIFDGDQPSSKDVMYDSDTGPSQPAFQRDQVVLIADHPWTPAVRSTRDFHATRTEGRPEIILGIGVALSLILFGVIRSLVIARQKAADLAHRMTADLRASERQATEALERLADAHRVLAAKERQFRTLAAAAPVAIFRTDSRGDVLFVNERWSDFTGMDAEAALGHGWSDALHAEDRVRVLEEWRKTVEQGGEFRLDFRFMAPQGKVTWVHGRAVAIRDDDGFISGYVGTGVDIGERRETTRRLSDLLTFRQAILDNVDNTVIATDSNGSITLFNRSAEDLLLYSREEMVGRETPLRIHHPDEVARRAKELEAEIGTPIEAAFEAIVWHSRRGRTERREWSYVRKDGTRFPVLLSVTALKDPHGEVVGFLGIGTDITERKLTEQKLAASEDRLRAIFDDVIDGIILIDDAGTISAFNPAAERIFGYHAAEVVGLNVNVLMPEPYRQEHDDYMKNYQQTGRTKIIGIGRQVRGRRKDGSVFPLDLSVGVMKSGRNRMFTGIVRDMTESMRARREVENNRQALDRLHRITADHSLPLETRLRRVLELGLVVFATEIAMLNRVDGDYCVIDQIIGPSTCPPAGTAVPISEAYCGLTLAAKTAVAYHRISESPMASAACYKRFGFEAFIGAPLVVAERIYGTISFYSPGGRDEPFVSSEISLIEIMAQWLGGEMTRNLTLRDLNRFKSTLDATNDCVFMFRPDSLKFFYANQGAINQVGFGSDDLIGKTPIDIMPLFSDDLFRGMIEPLAKGRESSILFETVHRHQDGHTIPVEVSLQYMESPGEEGRFIAVVRDITERKRLERMKNEFISTVSHELRTPLTSIRGSLGLVSAGAAGELSPKAGKLIEVAQRNTERLITLVNDILDIEKIESGKMEFRIVPVNLSALITQAIEANSAYAQQYQVVYSTRGDLPEIEVDIDPDRMMQVLCNLMSNAAKFSPAGGTIEIDLVRPAPGWVRLLVIDHGSGIPESFRHRVFQKFVQADASDTRAKGGTGLGLSISKAIVERLAGRIDFGVTPGGGATFMVDLQERPRRAEPPVPPSSAAAPRGTGRPRVLHVESDADLIHVLGNLIADFADLEPAHSVAQAEALLGTGVFHLVVLDPDLPDGSGYQLLAKIKRKFPGLPILVFSAGPGERRQSVSEVAVSLVKSQTDEARLRETIRSLLTDLGAAADAARL